MGRAYTDIAFTSKVREVQTLMGSRSSYEALDHTDERRDTLTSREVEFIEERDGFYQATVSETGWPYVQFRGGPAGFLKVLDAKTGSDITHAILTQIIMDEEANGEQMLPVSFLRQLIGMYGNSMQAMMPSYLEASMANFRENQSKIREAFEKGISATPFAAIHETNMAMMRAAADVFMPGLGKGKDKPAPKPATEPRDEIAVLREQMAAMQKKLDDLSK